MYYERKCSTSTYRLSAANVSKLLVVGKTERALTIHKKTAMLSLIHSIALFLSTEIK